MVSNLKELNKWVDQSFRSFDQVVRQFERLYQKLESRLSPLIEQLKPIFDDPLWQFVGLIFIVFVALIVTFWLLRKLVKTTGAVISWLTAIVRRSLKALLWPFLWLRKISHKKSPSKKEKKKRQKQRLSMARIRRAINAIQYLTTRREWRYHMAWSLLIGEPSSGKSQLVQSLQQGKRAQLLPREKHLKTTASGWHFFDHGVVIESTAECLSDNLEQFNWYRPERPLDQIILCVSAGSLLNVDTPADLDDLGEALFQQLWEVQKRTGFILPVYVLITQCDQVEGFSAFWQAQGETVTQQMVGWSNPNRLQTAFNPDWTNDVFEELLVSLRKAQLQSASSGQDIVNIDDFMLFLNEFSTLQKPLGQVMERAFSHSSLQEPFPLRGVYFCGQLEEKTAFIEEVFQQKIFVEKHLASILEKRRFSSNKILRKFQLGVLGGALAMFILLLVDTLRVSNVNQYRHETLTRLNAIPSDCSAQGLDTYKVLRGLSEIGDASWALSMPLSWLGIEERSKQQLVATHLLEKTLFPALACRLELRAHDLNVANQAKIEATHYQPLIQQMNAYHQKLVAFESAQQNYLELVSYKESARGMTKVLNELLDYLYDNPLPSDIELHKPLIDGAIQRSYYNGLNINQSESLVARRASFNVMDELTQKVQQALLQHVLDIFTSLKNVSNHGAVPKDSVLPKALLLEENAELLSWFALTKRDWLSSNASTSPCGMLAEDMEGIRRELIGYGFDAKELAEIVNRFDQSMCDQPVRKALADLNFPPFGALFVLDEKGFLEESSNTKKLVKKFAAMTDLTFMESSYPPVVDSSEGIVLWQEAPLQYLLDTLIQYQAFHQEYSEPKAFNKEVNDRLQQVTQRLLSQAMVRPSQRVNAPKSVIDLISYHERTLAEAVGSFKNVQALLLQIDTLLRQRGDASNVLWLKQEIQQFVLQQLEQLDALVVEYRLYQPVSKPQWHTANFAQALFNVNDDKAAQVYLTNQQQKLSYFAFNYAQVLLQYLQNSGSGLSDQNVRRWLTTLQDLGRFERGEPDNQVSLLNDLLSKKLTGLSNETCPQQGSFVIEGNSGSWFAERREQLEQQVNLHCSRAEKKVLIDRYQAIATAFNDQLAGRYPFAGLQKAGQKDVSNKALQGFLTYYSESSSNLLQALQKQQRKDGSIPNSWIAFIQQMNAIQDFFQYSWQAKAKNWQVDLQVTFDSQGTLSAAHLSRANQPKGSNQVIEWRLQSGTTQALFPNGSEHITWLAGKPMALNLRWAKGSPYLPIHIPGAQSDPLQVGSRASLSARFSSKSRWALFEWLQRYGTGASELEVNEHLLSFYVPVGLKGEQEHTDQPAYVSRANLLLQAQVSDAKGESQALALPRHFPTYAP